MTTIAVISILIGEPPYKAAALKNHHEYCARHSYSYFCLTDPLNDFPPTWQKPDLILQKFDEGFDYVFWMDGDSFFINQERRLEDFAKLDKDFVASGDFNDIVNAGHLWFKNTGWSRAFIHEWLAFRRPLAAETYNQFSQITTHIFWRKGQPMMGDQSPINILLAGGHAADDSNWFEMFNRVNLYAGNVYRIHQSAEYGPITPENLPRAQSLVEPNLAPHVAILNQSEMNSYPDTYKKGDFILHFVSHKHEFAQILRAL